jgi:hypothetical protein
MAFYKYITEKRGDSLDLKQVMESVSTDLVNKSTDDLKPGILLGLIQSGKTRAFVGTIARCFDLGFDVAIVFTKNSVALAEQTMKRLKSEFELPVQRNKLYVWDIIRLQTFEQLTGYVLANKIILVVKKEIKNLEKLHKLFDETELIKKRVLIVDDEADQASVSFVSDRSKEDGLDFAKIASSISEFRKKLKGKNSFLQVTATPYSLYLQPEDQSINGEEYAPLRPAFTHILHPHEFYIGGKYYFEESLKNESPASFVHVLVLEEELDFLNYKKKSTGSYDERILKNLLTTPKIDRLRFAILSFLVGGAIRQLQEQSDDFWAKPYHCSFVMHTSTQKLIHRMQKEMVERFIEELKQCSKRELSGLINNPFDGLLKSITASNLPIVAFEDVLDAVFNALKNNHVGLVEVNSENQVAELLGEDGQLRLDNPYNIFLGGQSLDRGITIDHLIGFYYGRNPGTFQMDTVLQHSRMYGSRSKEDLAVTRFYTSAKIYEAMRSMYWFDKDLRENIEKDVQTATARFIAKKGTTIVPAGPNKLKASNLISFKAYSRLLPVGFQTYSHTDIKKTIADINHFIQSRKEEGKFHFKISQDEAGSLVRQIRETFAYEPRFSNTGLEWDVEPFLKALELGMKWSVKDYLYLYFRENRDVSRYKYSGASFSDSPDDGKVDLPYSRQLAEDAPVLMVLHQLGREEQGWRNAPFYWPVLLMPGSVPNYVYCEG